MIDQRMREHPLVWSTDSMYINTPSENKEVVVDKPFCCTHCGSENYIKYGKKNKKQVFKCKDCNHKFFDNLFFKGMKANPKIICLTLDLYFKGFSLRKISEHLKQFYDLNIYFTTVYRWIVKYVEIMDKYVSQFKPSLGITWCVDEMMLQVDGDWFYLWNAMDTETRFHLASVISKERMIKDARKVFQMAKKTGHNQKPRRIITDGLQSYHKAIKKEFNTVKRETIHLGNVPIRGRHLSNMKFDNNRVERLHGTIRDRNKVQRGLEIPESVFIKGHKLYYNFIRHHMALEGITPAEKSGIDLGLDVKKWENLLMKSLKYNKEVDVKC